MELAFALFKYFPFGGLQRDMLAIARACQARGHRVTVYCSIWEGDQPDDLPVEILPVEALSNHSHDRLFSLRLQERLRERPGVTVVGFNKMPGLDIYYAADSCFAAKAFEERSWLYRQTRRSRQYLALERAVFGSDSATQILLISPREAEVFRRYYETPPERLHLLPPGIRRDRVVPMDYARQRADLRSQWEVGADERLLLFVGSGFRTKGLDRALAGLAALSKATRSRLQLWVAGQDKSGSFRKQARQLGVLDQVRFLGGRDDIPQLLWAADLLIHPAYRENTGTVLLEAMVAGLPVLTSDACGYAPYVEAHAMGRVLASEEITPRRVAEAISELLAVEHAQWVERGREFSATADIFDMPARAAALIEQLAGQAGARA